MPRPLGTTSLGGYPGDPQIGPLGTPFGTPPETLQLGSPPRETEIHSIVRLDDWLGIMGPQNPPNRDPKRTHFGPIWTPSGPISDPLDLDLNRGCHFWSPPTKHVPSKGASEGAFNHTRQSAKHRACARSTRHRGGIPDLETETLGV